MCWTVYKSHGKKRDDSIRLEGDVTKEVTVHHDNKEEPETDNTLVPQPFKVVLNLSV